MLADYSENIQTRTKNRQMSVTFASKNIIKWKIKYSNIRISTWKISDKCKSGFKNSNLTKQKQANWKMLTLTFPSKKSSSLS